MVVSLFLSDSQSDNGDSLQVAPRWITFIGWICWTKGWFMSWAERSGTVHFTALLRIAHGLKLINYLFLVFHLMVN